MQIAPIGDRKVEDFPFSIDTSYSPSAVFGYIVDDDGGERPLIFSFARTAWLTAKRGEAAVELPQRDQEQVMRLLAPNVRSVQNALMKHGG
jgi:hypothetical protein